MTFTVSRYSEESGYWESIEHWSKEENRFHLVTFETREDAEAYALDLSTAYKPAVYRPDPWKDGDAIYFNGQRYVPGGN